MRSAWSSPSSACSWRTRSNILSRSTSPWPTLTPPVQLVGRRLQHKFWQIMAVSLVVWSSDVEEGPLPFLHRLKRHRIRVACLGVGVDGGGAAADHHLLDNRRQAK